MLQISKQDNPFNLFYFVLAEKATLLSQLILRLAKWQHGLGCSRYFLASLRSLVAPGDPCPHRGHATQRALWLGFLRRGANMSFRIYTFCIHPGERIFSLGDMKTFCVWEMSRIFCGASWLAILSFIGQLWTHHYCQISFPPFLGWDLRAKRIFCKCYF